jgi:phosphoserine phosphatase
MGHSEEKFISSILRLKPRVAVFDCDGTLWGNNAGEDFFYWSMGESGGRRLVSEETARWARERYAGYSDGNVAEDVMCGEMTTMYNGVRVGEIESAALQFFKEHVAANIFLDMRELTRELARSGCRLWAISSTNEWVIRAGLRDFPFPAENILAAAVTVRDGVASDELIRVPTGPGKASAIREFIRGQVNLVFGNSVHDAAMLELAEHAFAVNPNPDLEGHARARGWTVYWPTATKALSAK